MPKAGYKQTMTPNNVAQRQQAARSHGGYAYQARGESSLDAPGRSLLAELQDSVSTRLKLLGVLQDQVVDAIMITRILKNHIVEQVRSGIPVESVTALKALGTYQNTAMRGIQLLLAEMPNDGDVLDAAMVLDAIRGQDDDESNG
jgi:hypothetical protein